jgi:hypothetical protein
MSAFAGVASGTKRTSLIATQMSAIGPKADIPSCNAHVRSRGLSGHAVLHCICPLLTKADIDYPGPFFRTSCDYRRLAEFFQLNQIAMRLTRLAIAIAPATGFIGARYGLPYFEPLIFLAVRMAFAVLIMAAIAIID